MKLDGVVNVETFDHGHAVRLTMQGPADAFANADLSHWSAGNVLLR